MLEKMLAYFDKTTSIRIQPLNEIGYRKNNGFQIVTSVGSFITTLLSCELGYCCYGNIPVTLLHVGNAMGGESEITLWTNKPFLLTFRVDYLHLLSYKGFMTEATTPH